MRRLIVGLIIGALAYCPAPVSAQNGGLSPTPIYVPIALSCGPAFNFLASSTYYCGVGTIDGTDGGSGITGPVVCMYPFATYRSHVAGVQSSAQTSVLSLRVSSTDYTLVAALNTSTNTPQAGSVLTGLPTTIAAASLLQIKFATGAWTPTVPTSTTINVVLYCRVQ